MKVLGLCGWSGAGKTTLAEQLIGHLRAAGQRVSSVKHAHHGFELDRPGKDSWRMRQAGAYEVVVASDILRAKLRALETPAEPSVHELMAELSPCDWVLVEGYRHADLPKFEVWRAALQREPLYPTDPHVRAVVTDHPEQLPIATTLPVLRLDQPAEVVQHLLRTASAYAYVPRR